MQTLWPTFWISICFRRARRNCRMKASCSNRFESKPPGETATQTLTTKNKDACQYSHHSEEPTEPLGLSSAKRPWRSRRFWRITKSRPLLRVLTHLLPIGKDE